MANNTIRATIIMRNDTAANWKTNNPILADGELGIEKDTRLVKLGDGVTAYNALPYINDAKSINEVDVGNLVQTDTILILDCGDSTSDVSNNP